MTRRFLFAGIAALACSAFVSAADEPLPKAETILDRSLEVTGGKAAYEKRKSEVTTGTFDFVGKGVKGTLEVYSDTTNNQYTAINLEGVGLMESGVYNGVAWDSNPMQGSRLKDGAEKADAVRDATFNAALLWRDLYSKVETVGMEDVNGEPAYKVQLTPKSGSPATVYFGKKSGLMLKRTATAATPMGDIPMEMTFSDYKQMSGVLVPTKLLISQMGQEFEITITDQKVNTEIPKDRFVPPAEVQKLMAKPAADTPAKAPAPSE